MPYNGAGVFQLYSPGNPVVTGTVISSTWANNTLSDIATGLSTAITKNGQTTVTGNIPFGGYKLTGVGPSNLTIPDSYSDTATATLGDALIGFKQSNSGGALTGAVARTVHQKFQEMVSVKDFGATGDGVTDDAATLQAAITACANNFLYLPPGTYLTGTALSSASTINIIGAAFRTTALEWTGGASAMLTITNAADNCEITNIELNNSGTGTVGLQINCQRVKLGRIFANPDVKFSTAIIRTNTAGTVYQFVARDCALYSSAVGEENPIAMYLARGHSFTVDNCMFSGNDVAIRAGISGGEPVQQLNVVNSRIETFAGVTPGYPGDANALGIDAVNVYALNVRGTDFELDGNGEVAGATNRGIKMTTVYGGEISGCYMSGTGQVTMAIEVANAAATNVVIQGNDFYNMNGYGVGVSGSGKLYNVEIGTNNVHGGTTGSYNNTVTFTDQSGAGLSFSNVSGEWQRVGSSVEVFGTLTYPATADVSVAAIGGLPAPIPNVNRAQALFPLQNSTGVTAFITPNKNTSKVTVSGFNNGTGVTNASLSGATVNFWFTYPFSA